MCFKYLTILLRLHDSTLNRNKHAHTTIVKPIVPPLHRQCLAILNYTIGVNSSMEVMTRLLPNPEVLAAHRRAKGTPENRVLSRLKALELQRGERPDSEAEGTREREQGREKEGKKGGEKGKESTQDKEPAHKELRTTSGVPTEPTNKAAQDSTESPQLESAKEREVSQAGAEKEEQKPARPRYGRRARGDKQGLEEDKASAEENKTEGGPSALDIGLRG
jgi:hypothetical protein